MRAGGLVRTHDDRNACPRGEIREENPRNRFPRVPRQSVYSLQLYEPAILNLKTYKNEIETLIIGFRVPAFMCLPVINADLSQVRLNYTNIETFPTELNGPPIKSWSYLAIQCNFELFRISCKKSKIIWITAPDPSLNQPLRQNKKM